MLAGWRILLLQKDNDLIVYHANDGKAGEPWLQIPTISWEDGWPRAAIETPSN